MTGCLPSGAKPGREKCNARAFGSSEATPGCYRAPGSLSGIQGAPQATWLGLRTACGSVNGQLGFNFIATFTTTANSNFIISTCSITFELANDFTMKEESPIFWR